MIRYTVYCFLWWVNFIACVFNSIFTFVTDKFTKNEVKL